MSWMDHFSCARLPEVSAETVRLAQQSEIEQQTQEFEANGGKIERVDCVLDQYEKERQERIQKWGKTLHDEPVERKKKAKPPVVEHQTQEHLITFAEAGEILGYGDTWMRTRVNNGYFSTLTIVEVKNGRRLVASEVRALAPKHHKDTVDKSRFFTSKPETLSVSDVLSIKRRLANGVPQIELCREFGITPSSMSRIARGESWSHIKLEEY